MSVKQVHPALTAHEKIAELNQEHGEEWVPSHKQLFPYLMQLPDKVKYKIVDPELVPWSREFREWQDSLTKVGLEVQFSNDSEYGGCQMIVTRDHKVGLEIWVNGCALASAMSYYIVPE